MIQTVEHESIITEDEYNLIKQIQIIKDNYKLKYSEWLKLKEIIQYCKYMLDESQKRLIQGIVVFVFFCIKKLLLLLLRNLFIRSPRKRNIHFVIYIYRESILFKIY